MSETTPRPWTVSVWDHDDEVADILSDASGWVAETVETADARLIVRAVNAHSVLLDALRALADRLDEINLHPSFAGIHSIAHVHGFEYDGPTWVEPLADARAAIALAEQD